MGILDGIRGKADELDKDYNPLRKAADAIAAAPAKPVETTPQQLQYEARERAMNRKNPYFKNVDNSGLTKEPIR